MLALLKRYFWRPLAMRLLVNEDLSNAFHQ